MTVDGGAAPGGVSIRLVIGGTALAIATLVVALGFAANLQALTQHPASYGWNWDVAIRAGQGFGSLDTELTASILSSDPDIESWSSAYLGDDLIDGIDVPLLGMSPTADVRPPVVGGRFIVGTDEVVLGASTASSLHARIGDTVSIGTDQTARSLRVVGIVILPSIGRQHVQHPALGNGAIVTPELLPGVADPSNASGPQLAFIRFQRGLNSSAAIQRLSARIGPLGGVSDLDLLSAQRPAEIVNTSSLGGAPLLVAATFAGIAVLALGFALVASVRRHARDLAVLRSLGLEDRQMFWALIWHAYTILVSGMIVGIPIGLAASAWLWRAFADELDVVATNRVPTVALTLVGSTAIIVVGLVAIGPAFTARRLAPATILRST